MARFRVRWGRIAGLLVAVGLVAGGVKLLTAGLPPAPAHSRAAPDLTALPLVEVCWLELSRSDVWGQLGTAGLTRTDTWRNTASALLVRHPKGDVLIDAGYSPHVHEEVAQRPWLARFFNTVALRGLRDRASVSEALQKVGASPGGLKWFIPSHAHLDHLGGMVELREVPVLLPSEEQALIQAWRERGEVFPEHALAVEGRMTAMAFQPRPYENFDEHFDVFGDGVLVVTRIPGHTPGSIATFVNLSPTRRLVHVGDTVNLAESIQRRVPKSTLLQFFTDTDAEAAGLAVARLAQLHDMEPALHFLPAHDRDAWERFFGGAQTCVKAR
ncbi:MBL fold metallo-hydrolase [Pyxidicoccus fallax]|uniref:MBL fold metallo-hydrolase n=1 Tax=Pyxidicoccus fallax TaxID=394095 RepID=A0A848LDK6_9BACT|nr:MBL fold metallo-hydrolase [Pyxidicoccus fallax]NMO17170.1 MBL fold metallo-hydrolase [Pyxidicoccus fallax]NPC86594.1 MBL fold metallo-hydrolase [Pyxidicoccus fallax]